MHNEILNLIRVALLGFLVFTGAAVGVTTEPSSYQEPMETTCLETTAETTQEATDAIATEAPTEPSAPTEEEPTTETTTPEDEPLSATEPATEETTAETEVTTEETEVATEETEVTTEVITTTEPPETEPAVAWRSLGTYTLTAYCSCHICCGEYALDRPIDNNGNPIVYTSIGAVAKAGVTIAVDPSVIPYGTEVRINDHIYIAQDTGGAIKGNRIDVYYDDHQAALQFGRQDFEVFIPA